MNIKKQITKKKKIWTYPIDVSFLLELKLIIENELGRTTRKYGRREASVYFRTKCDRVVDWTEDFCEYLEDQNQATLTRTEKSCTEC